MSRSVRNVSMPRGSCLKIEGWYHVDMHTYATRAPSIGLRPKGNRGVKQYNEIESEYSWCDDRLA